MKRIIIDFVGQYQQSEKERVFDYYETDYNMVFKITRMSNEVYSFAALIHALVEWFTLIQDGMDLKELADFNKENPALPDSGALREAPHHMNHNEAEAIERLILAIHGKSWHDYIKAQEVAKGMQ